MVAINRFATTGREVPTQPAAIRSLLDIWNAYRFFKEHAWYCVGRRAAGALELARAERSAASQGIRFVWEEDSIPDGPREWGWSDRECEEWDESDHICECCIAYDQNGNLRASLSGIWDADQNYRRVVEAELALEALNIQL